MKKEINEIIEREFENLLLLIENDFINNYKRKKETNFLVSELDDMMTAHLVFVSSFESKSGNSFQKIAREIAKLRYHPQNVPQIINPNNIRHDFIEDENKEQFLVTNVNIDKDELKGKISEFMASKTSNGRGRERKECSLDQDSIKDLLYLSERYKDKETHCKPVDLAFYDENQFLNIMEIKAGGDLDSSNAPANAEKLLRIYVGANNLNTKTYFATLYNKNGDKNNWSGIMKKYLKYPDMFLIGENFWNKILPSGVDYTLFKKIYRESIEGIKLNDRLNLMIKKAVC
jgi:hypothetical protein